MTQLGCRRSGWCRGRRWCWGRVAPEGPAARAGRGSVLGTLGDAYVNSIMVDALIHSREGTIVVPEAAAQDTLRPSAADHRDDKANGTLGAVGSRLYRDRRDDAGHRFSDIWHQCIPDQVVRLRVHVVADRGNSASRTNNLRTTDSLVLSWAQLRDERATEIMAEIDPQYAFWSSIVYLHPERTKRTFELINMVLHSASTWKCASSMRWAAIVLSNTMRRCNR